jgi:hypothetical protein
MSLKHLLPPSDAQVARAERLLYTHRALARDRTRGLVSETGRKLRSPVGLMLAAGLFYVVASGKGRILLAGVSAVRAAVPIARLLGLRL